MDVKYKFSSQQNDRKYFRQSVQFSINVRWWILLNLLILDVTIWFFLINIIKILRIITNTGSKIKTTEEANMYLFIFAYIKSTQCPLWVQYERLICKNASKLFAPYIELIKEARGPKIQRHYCVCFITLLQFTILAHMSCQVSNAHIVSISLTFLSTYWSWIGILSENFICSFYASIICPDWPWCLLITWSKESSCD